MKNDIKCAVLQVLSYFHYFKYPLNQHEIHKYLPVSSSKGLVEKTLTELLKAGMVYQIGEYYSLNNDPELVQRRIKGNIYAAKQLKKATRIASFLGNFPFVEAVCISGSLSKDFSLPDGDIDFFIITSAKRLWIARSIMHLFKKLTFLVGAQHSFCMNYYISMENLAISPQNTFTAIEIATLKPVFVREGFLEMYRANEQWIKIFLPNFEFASTGKTNKKWLPVYWLEKIIDTRGVKLNDYLYNFSRRQWTKKWQRQGYDTGKCLDCMDVHVNTPVNYPKNFVDDMLEGYKQIYNKVLNVAKEKSVVIPHPVSTHH